MNPKDGFVERPHIPDAVAIKRIRALIIYGNAFEENGLDTLDKIEEVLSEAEEVK